jgi:hypothetical protein
MEGLAANEGRLDGGPPYDLQWFLGNVGRDPNIAHELYKQGRLKKAVGLQAISHRTAWKIPGILSKPHRSHKEEGLKKLPLITH